MSKGFKVFLGIASFYLLFSVPIAFILTRGFLEQFFRLFFEIYHVHVPPGIERVFDKVQLVNAYLALLLLILFVVHAYRHEQTTEQRWLWIAFIVLGLILAFPVYWYLKIWPQPLERA